VKLLTPDHRDLLAATTMLAVIFILDMLGRSTLDKLLGGTVKPIPEHSSDWLPWKPTGKPDCSACLVTCTGNSTLTWYKNVLVLPKAESGRNRRWRCLHYRQCFSYRWWCLSNRNRHKNGCRGDICFIDSGKRGRGICRE